MDARPVIEQTFFSASILVGTVPTPLAGSLTTTSMIDAFILSNFSTNANSVFGGDAGITTNAGVEIIKGAGVTFRISQTRQLYEIQNPVLVSAQVALCSTMPPDSIPVIVWNPSNFYLIASAPTTIGVIFFRNVYV